MKEMILVSAIWCPSCLIMRPRYQKIAKELKIDKFTEYDFDDDEEEVKKFHLGKTLPVMLIFENGIEIKRIVGEKSLKELGKLLC